MLTNIAAIARQMLDIYSRKPRPSLKIQGHARVTRTNNVETAVYTLMPTDASEYNLQLPLILPVSISGSRRTPTLWTAARGHHKIERIHSSPCNVRPLIPQWSVVCYPGVRGSSIYGHGSDTMGERLYQCGVAGDAACGKTTFLKWLEKRLIHE